MNLEILFSSVSRKVLLIVQLYFLLLHCNYSLKLSCPSLKQVTYSSPASYDGLGGNKKVLW